uniref:(California timema) hypothetical protein n=1 Tax=Timema californicum TaxID=61474 RepID=A0A7R9J3I2_TIMCA|nr:unnamed protein product [Timema californicum]
MGKTETREERKRKKRGKEKTEVPRNAARAAALWARDFNPMSVPFISNIGLYSMDVCEICHAGVLAILVVISLKAWFSDEMTVHVSPAEPRYFSFKFLNDGRDTVLLRVDSPDDLCMTVSIQNISCPVFDLEKNVLFEGYWQSMSRRGGITLTPQLGGMGYRPVCKNDVGVGEKEESATPEEGSCVVLERLV